MLTWMHFNSAKWLNVKIRYINTKFVCDNRGGITMSLMPAFEIGFWNAWIFIIPFIIYWFVGVRFLFSKRMPENPPLERRKDRIISQMLALAMFFSFFYSIFVPIELGMIWFYIGLLIYFAGMILITLTMRDFATTPMDKPVTKGVYRYSRNPMFIGYFLVYAGIAIACVSWVYILLTIIFILIVIYLSPIEEAITLEHYGKSYEEYIKRTPKWIGTAKRKL